MNTSTQSPKSRLFIALAAAASLLVACKEGAKPGGKSDAQIGPAPETAAAPAVTAAPAPTDSVVAVAPASTPAAEPAKPAAATPAPSATLAAPATKAVTPLVPKGTPPKSTPLGVVDYALPLQPVSNMAPLFGAYRGKPALLFYFGPTCPHCQAAFPEVQAFADDIRSKGVETVAIATSRSNAQEVQEFITTYRSHLPTYLDTDRKFGGAYDVKLLPTLYWVGKDGQISKVENYSGKATLDSLRARI